MQEPHQGCKSFKYNYIWKEFSKNVHQSTKYCLPTFFCDLKASSTSNIKVQIIVLLVLLAVSIENENKIFLNRLAQNISLCR